MDIGETWNESESCEDALTGRMVRRLTTRGRINQTPTYHTNSGFTSDGRYLVLASVREGTTWILRAEPASGELKALWRAPGIGDRSYIHRGMGLTFDDVDGRGICGNRVCMAAKAGLAVFTCERRILAVDIATCEERVLLDDCGEAWIFGAPCVSPDEQWVAIALSSAHPQMLAGEPVTRHYRSYPDHKLKLIRVALDGSGKTEALYEREAAQSAHCAFCPTDGNLLYFDLDLPPGYWAGGDPDSSGRIWLLDLAARAPRPLKEDYPGPFQTHTVWLWDGSGMIYHGALPGGGTYIGCTDTHGRTLWEREYREARHYGHLTSDARRRALILDGEFSDDLLQWLHYGEDGPDDPPRCEPICRHATEWGSLPGQYSHPHPLTDASGRWISFTAARDGRSDVYVVDAG